jgi:hypothetical protein
LPSISIDSFFACSLIVSVALIAVAFAAGSLHTQIGSVEDVNKMGYLQGIADHIVSNCGAPADWGSSSTIPSSFGLADDSQTPFSLDVDKVTRLNSDNTFALGYFEMLQAARLDNIALSVSVTQMLSVDVDLYSNVSLGDVTSYTFRMQVSQDSGPLSASLRGYVVAGDFESNVSGFTDESGISFVSVEVPNVASGPGLLVAFARATFDDKITAFGICQFEHASGEFAPNHTFLDLSPLNNGLTVESKSENASASCVYAFSFGYSWNITSSFSGTYAIPESADAGPLVLVAQGTDSMDGFVEWNAYPSVPFVAGADLSRSEANVFTYTVAIRSGLYRLTLRFGDVVG